MKNRLPAGMSGITEAPLQRCLGVSDVMCVCVCVCVCVGRTVKVSILNVKMENGKVRRIKK